MKNKTPKNIDVILYRNDQQDISVEVLYSGETVWLTQEQMAKLFRKAKSTVNEHIKNIYKERELQEKKTKRKFGNSEFAVKPTNFYNLDVIISVGYRVKSLQGTQFRIWATKTLRNYILKGYAVNKKLIRKNYNLFQNVVDDIRKLLPSNTNVETLGILEIIQTFSNTWLSLDAYDRENLPTKGKTIKKIDLTAQELLDDIQTLKKELLSNKTASELFAKERFEGGIENIVRNVFQSFGGKDLYPTIEEKAAQLLYFVVKNHPFVDGNKRSGAFSFLWFLKRANILNTLKISPEVLTTLTILVAESKTEDKDRMTRVILMVLVN